MQVQIRALLWGSAVLLALPAGLWLWDGRWTPEWIGVSAPWLYGVTESAGTCGAALTSLVWSAVIGWPWRGAWRRAWVWLAAVALLLALGQGVKTLVKHQVAAPRPHVQWLASQEGVSSTEYYRLTPMQRQQWLAERSASQPSWLLTHWQHETDSAFPSGHSVFATTWALLAWVMLWPQRRWRALGLITAWALVVMASRVVLGMHSAPDLAGATLLSAVLVAAGGWGWQRLHRAGRPG